jgi:hypothetical protein
LSSNKGRTISRNSGPAVLGAMPGTRAQIEAKTGLSLSAVQKRVTLLRRADLAHIGGWERAPDGAQGSHWIAVYHAGPGPDVPCRFKPKTRKQINAAFLRRARESGAIDTINAKKRAQYWKAKAVTRGDPLVLALFGRRK